MVTLYIAATPDVEASGASILSVIKSVGPFYQPLLEKHKLENINPEGWYSQQQWLDFLRDLAEGEGSIIDLVSIGMKIPETASFPPQVNSVESALQMLNDAYHMNNRNDPVRDRWEYAKVAEGEYDITCRTPVPRDFEYGVVYGLVKRFTPKGMHYTVQRELQADGSAIFKVKLSK